MARHMLWGGGHTPAAVRARLCPNAGLRLPVAHMAAARAGLKVRDRDTGGVHLISVPVCMQAHLTVAHGRRACRIEG